MTRIPKLLLLLAASCSVCMAAPCNAATTRGEVLLESRVVTLGDIFLNAGDKAGLIVRDAPAPGQKIALDVTALGQIARSAGFDWKAENTYERVVITRDSHGINSARIKELVAGELVKTYPARDLDVILDNQSIEIYRAKNEPLNYHLGELKIDPIKNRFETSLMVEREGSTDADVIKVTGRMLIMTKVAILTRSVTTGDLLATQDVEWTRIATEKAGVDAVTDLSRLANTEMRRSLNAGSVLRMHDLRNAKMVSKGSMITIAVETPMMTLTTQGRAMADGALGDTIQVINTQSNKSIDAVVVASGKVSVSPLHETKKIAAR